MEPLTIALLSIAGCILLAWGPRVLFSVILVPTALFIGLLALLLVIGCGVLAVRDERRRIAGTHWADRPSDPRRGRKPAAA